MNKLTKSDNCCTMIIASSHAHYCSCTLQLIIHEIIQAGSDGKITIKFAWPNYHSVL